MSIHLKFFSVLKERFRTGERDVDLAGPKTAGEIFCSLFEDQELASRFLKSVRVAINCEYVGTDVVVRDGDELAFIPPVSGG